MLDVRSIGNADVMAWQSVCDGLKMLWRDLAQDELTRRIERLQDLVLTRTDTDPGELSKHVKMKVIRASGEKRGGLVAVQLTGPAARVFGHLPWSWAYSLSQVHFKTYAEEVFDGATNAFADAMFQSDGTGQLSFFSARKVNNRPKDGGSKGTRVGSRKSDVHTIVYKRQRQRTGIETRVQDQALIKAVNDIEVLTGGFEDETSDARKYGALHRRAAHHGYKTFLRELRRRGVRITDYFSSCSPHPEGEYVVNGFTALNSQEEAAATTHP